MEVIKMQQAKKEIEDLFSVKFNRINGLILGRKIEEWEKVVISSICYNNKVDYFIRNYSVEIFTRK